eukprot:TRINITY_DN1276_c0_g1_i1.p2 TRINITY_DN1276_c0_g1~~TRINITY_DN1276_c0_g1_i1.p2  ORF type:complete len:118 (-),score=23.24 TRINITY_DN1276_c0_g1_i1:284-637(-)
MLDKFTDYEMPKFKDSKRKRLEDTTPKTRERKPGPRDIGKNDDYEMPKFKPSKRRSKSPDPKSKRIARKTGPRDVVKDDDYKMPSFKNKKKSQKEKDDLDDGLPMFSNVNKKTDVKK